MSRGSLSRLPVACQLLGLADFLRRHFGRHFIASFHGLVAFVVVVRGKTGGSKIEPYMGVQVTLLHALALTIHYPRVELSLCVSCVGGTTGPPRRVGKALGNSLARSV